MAKVQTANHSAKPKRKRSGVHSKTKNSVSKNAKNYVKAYRGQGK